MKGSFIARTAAVAALSVAALASSASAQYRLNIGGFSANVSQTVVGDPLAPVLIDFVDNATAENVTTLPGVPVGTIGTLADFLVTETGCGSCPVNVLTIGAYTFRMTTTPVYTGSLGPNDIAFGPIALRDEGAGFGSSASVRGMGTVTGGIFGAGSANFSVLFTAQFVDGDDSPIEIFNDVVGGGTRNVSASAEFIISRASTVPEPSTYVLMATGLLGVVGAGFARRRIS